MRVSTGTPSWRWPTQQPSEATPSMPPKRQHTFNCGTTSPQHWTHRSTASRAARPVSAAAPGEPTTLWQARAVLYAVESGQPDISRTKLTGLVDHYGFTAGSKSTEYFELHSDRDHEHAAASAEVLSKAAPEDADRLVAAAEAALKGNWRLLDGVESRV